MFDLKYDPDEFRQAIEELVPGFQRSAVLSVLESNEGDQRDFDAIGLGLTGEKVESSFIFLTGARAQKDPKSIWGAIKEELFELLCTTSKKYANERKEGGVTIKQLVLIIATAVSAQFHVAIGVIAGAVTVAVMSALKITKNAWCEVNLPVKQ